MKMNLLNDFDLFGKRVLIREDLNVPIKNNLVTSDARIRAALPTINYALERGAKVIIMSHLGRPTEGGDVNENAKYSLAPVASSLSCLLDKPIELVNDWHNGLDLENGEACLLENVRFNVGEKINDDFLSKKYASLCDIYVMDAFGTSHRAQASTHGVAKYAPIACAGPLLVEELRALDKALRSPPRPLVAVVGGSKVSTKLTVLETLSQKVDKLIVGGGIANTFMAANGNRVGKSLCEHELLDTAKNLLQQAHIPLPEDVVTGKEFSSETDAEHKMINDINENDMVFDIGEKTQQKFKEILSSAKTIIWNGPVGVFEFEKFSSGTKTISEAIADSDAFSIAGGGDTLAAIDKYNLSKKISYISTGGGAFLEFVEGKKLPAVSILEKRFQEGKK
jgi:phosphoglycerate kinase